MKPMLQMNPEKTQDRPIFSIDADEVSRLNALFWEQDIRRRNNIVTFSRVGSASVATATVVFATPVLATGAGGSGAGGGGTDAAATIATNVEAAISMIKAIDGIGNAAFAAALAPIGFMLTLRVLNMVLSRV
jgi:hypothetical protein